MLARDGKLLGTSALATLAILNWIGLRTGSRAQEATSLVEALALVGIVIAAFTMPGRASATVLAFTDSFARVGAGMPN